MRKILTPLLLICSLVPGVRAADGFDNNLISTDAFELLIDLYGSGNEHRVVFGPSGMSGGGYYIPIPNNSEFNAGVANYFKIKKAWAHPRSAYWDRVDNVTLYYRIYPVGSPPGDENTGYIPLDDYAFSHTALNPNECYTTTTQDDWTMDRGSAHFDVLSGLGNGTYIFQFYVICDLHDVGDETTPCNINANLQCDNTYTHPNRQLSSRFPTGVTDPNVCSGNSNYYYGLTYAPGTKIRFQVTTSSPLTWLQFQAQKTREGIVLNWATEQERDVHHFDIQRSADGFRWTSIHEQHAVGYSAQRSDYEFTDLRPLPGIDYYRLRSIDFDGAESYSPTVVVRFGHAEEQAVMYPNPASGEVSFRLDAEVRKRVVDISLLDATGRWVKHWALSVPATDDQPLPLDDLREGLYWVEFRDENAERLATGKFLKLRN